MRLYRVTTDCRKCEHRYRMWITEAQRKSAFQHAPNDLIAVQTCPALRCGEDVPILARHLRESEFDLGRTREVGQNPALRNLHLRPNLLPSVPALTERQAKVCALILEGKTDRAIAREMRLSVETVRQHLEYAAKKLCVDEPIACRVMPRQTVVAYYTTRFGSEAPERAFQIPA